MTTFCLGGGVFVEGRKGPVKIKKKRDEIRVFLSKYINQWVNYELRIENTNTTTTTTTTTLFFNKNT